MKNEYTPPRAALQSFIMIFQEVAKLKSIIKYLPNRNSVLLFSANNHILYEYYIYLSIYIDIDIDIDIDR